jgi:hypothetical protein
MKGGAEALALLAVSKLSVVLSSSRGVRLRDSARLHIMHTPPPGYMVVYVQRFRAEGSGRCTCMMFQRPQKCHRVQSARSPDCSLKVSEWCRPSLRSGVRKPQELSRSGL